MKDNFITSMLSEGGKISHKRFISVLCTLIVGFLAVWATIKHAQHIPDIMHSFLIFIAVMSGVATVAQIVSLVNRTPEPKEEEKKP